MSDNLLAMNTSGSSDGYREIEVQQNGFRRKVVNTEVGVVGSIVCGLSVTRTKVMYEQPDRVRVEAR